MSQQAGTTRRIADTPCHEAYQHSLKCLDKNQYDKSKCQEAFDAYKKCKKDQFEADREARIAKRKGFFG